MTAQHIARELRGRRSGFGYVARCPAHDDRSPSLSIGERDGKILLHCHAGCSQADVIEALRSRGLWPEHEKPEWTPAERRQWARARREFERDLPAARYWLRGMIVVLDVMLEQEKQKLLDQAGGGPADTGLIRFCTSLLARLEHGTDSAVVDEYRWWRSEFPKHCAGLIAWAKNQERAEIRALAKYLGSAA